MIHFDEKGHRNPPRIARVGYSASSAEQERYTCTVLAEEECDMSLSNQDLTSKFGLIMAVSFRALNLVGPS